MSENDSDSESSVYGTVVENSEKDNNNNNKNTENGVTDTETGGDAPVSSSSSESEDAALLPVEQPNEDGGEEEDSSAAESSRAKGRGVVLERPSRSAKTRANAVLNDPEALAELERRIATGEAAEASEGEPYEGDGHSHGVDTTGEGCIPIAFVEVSFLRHIPYGAEGGGPKRMVVSLRSSMPPSCGWLPTSYPGYEGYMNTVYELNRLTTGGVLRQAGDEPPQPPAEDWAQDSSETSSESTATTTPAATTESRRPIGGDLSTSAGTQFAATRTLLDSKWKEVKLFPGDVLYPGGHRKVFRGRCELIIVDDENNAIYPDPWSSTFVAIVPYESPSRGSSVSSHAADPAPANHYQVLQAFGSKKLLVGPLTITTIAEELSRAVATSDITKSSVKRCFVHRDSTGKMCHGKLWNREELITNSETIVRSLITNSPLNSKIVAFVDHHWVNDDYLKLWHLFRKSRRALAALRPYAMQDNGSLRDLWTRFTQEGPVVFIDVERCAGGRSGIPMTLLLELRTLDESALMHMFEVWETMALFAGGGSYDDVKADYQRVMRELSSFQLTVQRVLASRCFDSDLVAFHDRKTRHWTARSPHLRTLVQEQAIYCLGEQWEDDLKKQQQKQQQHQKKKKNSAEEDDAGNTRAASASADGDMDVAKSPNTAEDLGLDSDNDDADDNEPLRFIVSRAAVYSAQRLYAQLRRRKSAENAVLVVSQRASMLETLKRVGLIGESRCTGDDPRFVHLTPTIHYSLDAVWREYGEEPLVLDVRTYLQLRRTNPDAVKADARVRKSTPTAPTTATATTADTTSNADGQAKKRLKTTKAPVPPNASSSSATKNNNNNSSSNSAAAAHLRRRHRRPCLLPAFPSANGSSARLIPTTSSSSTAVAHHIHASGRRNFMFIRNSGYIRLTQALGMCLPHSMNDEHMETLFPATGSEVCLVVWDAHCLDAATLALLLKTAPVSARVILCVPLGASTLAPTMAQTLEFLQTDIIVDTELVATSSNEGVLDNVPLMWSGWFCEEAQEVDPRISTDPTFVLAHHRAIVDRFAETFRSALDWHRKNNLRYRGALRFHQDATAGRSPATSPALARSKARQHNERRARDELDKATTCIVGWALLACRSFVLEWRREFRAVRSMFYAALRTAITHVVQTMGMRPGIDDAFEWPEAFLKAFTQRTQGSGGSGRGGTRYHPDVFRVGDLVYFDDDNKQGSGSGCGALTVDGVAHHMATLLPADHLDPLIDMRHRVGVIVDAFSTPDASMFARTPTTSFATRLGVSRVERGNHRHSIRVVYPCDGKSQKRCSSNMTCLTYRMDMVEGVRHACCLEVGSIVEPSVPSAIVVCSPVAESVARERQKRQLAHLVTKVSPAKLALFLPLPDDTKISRAHDASLRTYLSQEKSRVLRPGQTVSWESDSIISNNSALQMLGLDIEGHVATGNNNNNNTSMDALQSLPPVNRHGLNCLLNAISLQ